MAVVGMRRRGLALPRVDRRTLAGIVLAAAAALAVLVVTRPAPTIPTLVAAADLPAGMPMTGADVAVRHVPSAAGLVEGDALGDLEGWSLAAPLASGEPLLPSLLRAPARLDHPDVIAIALPETQAVLGRLAAGDLVDIYATTKGTGVEPATTELLAAGVYVVDARADGGSLSGAAEVELLLAVDGGLAARLAAARHTAELDVVRVGP